MSEWTSFDQDSMVEFDIPIIVTDGFISWVTDSSGLTYCENTGNVFDGNGYPITHWMPLPSPPND